MRSVLVCLRSALAEQAVANAAAQLGLSDVISTTAGGAEALARVARAPADILLVDTGAVRPDTVGFTQQVLKRSPEAVLVFLGPEESEIAQAAVAAGARGLIRGGEREDLVASVAKALMLLLRGGRSEAPSTVPLQRSEAAGAEDDPDGTVTTGMTGESGAGESAGDGNGGGPRPSTGSATPGAPAGSAAPGAPAGSAAPGPSTGSAAPGPSTGVADPGPSSGASRSAASVSPARGADPSGNGSAQASVTAARRLALTERELQVLRGMAEGKSNAEIGRELFVSEDTVKTHARRLFRKLSARDRAHAVAAAFRAGLVR